jgi:hypothetical protein
MIVLAAAVLSACADGNQPPSDPAVLYPLPGQVVPVDLVLRWSCSDPDGDPLTYDVDFGHKCLAAGWTQQAYPLTSLQYDTQYDWRIVAHDSEGNWRGGPRWSFRTEPAPALETVLADELVKVPPGQYLYWRLTLDRAVEVNGEIISDGDVNVWLLDEREYRAFEKSETFYPAQGWPRVLECSFSFRPAQPGAYWLVVDNPFSLFTAKMVRILLVSVQV